MSQACFKLTEGSQNYYIFYKNIKKGDCSRPYGLRAVLQSLMVTLPPFKRSQGTQCLRPALGAKFIYLFNYYLKSNHKEFNDPNERRDHKGATPVPLDLGSLNLEEVLFPVT